MKDLSIQRSLSEESRAQDILTPSKDVYALHIKGDEAIITDHSDYTKIYAVYSLEFLIKIVDKSPAPEITRI